MAVEYQNKSEVKVASGTSITIPIPTGWSAGDLLIAIISKDDDDAVSTPAGWIVIQNAAGGTAMRTWTGYRIAQTGDTQWTWTGDSEDYYGVILRYTGHDPNNPIHASGVATNKSATPTAPSVAFTDLTVGSLVVQVFGADDDDIPYTVPAQLTSRFNDSATTTGGAGGDREAGVGHWLSPTGFVDSGEEWDNEFRVYDEDTATNAIRNLIPAKTWSSYLELTIGAVSCNKVRFWAEYSSSWISQISLDVYYSSAWHNIYEGAYANLQWVEKEIGSTQIVTAMRVKFYNNDDLTKSARIYEADFWKVETATGETGTAVFIMNAIEEWVAVTAVIEAAEEESELINGYFMSDGEREEKFGYFMNLVETFGYFMNPKV